MPYKKKVSVDLNLLITDTLWITEVAQFETEIGEGAGYISVSYSVKVCTQLFLSVTNWLSKE